MRMILLAAAAAFACAQPADSPSFEVATIKLAAPMPMGRIMVGTRGGPGTPDPGRFTCNNCNLTMLISQGYDINFIQISGPPWMDSQRFDVIAKVPEHTTKAQFRVMIQNLLIERFKLAVHHDTKEMPIYELSVAKNGPKLRDSAGPVEMPQGGPRPFAPPKPGAEGPPALPEGRFPMMVMSPRGARWRLVDESMPDFAQQLQPQVGRPVTDATGLKGKYDIELTFSGGAGLVGLRMLGGVPPPPPGAPVQVQDGAEKGAPSTPEDNGPTIFTAIQEQLGLKLEAKKGPVDILVIDHVEKTPTEN